MKKRRRKKKEKLFTPRIFFLFHFHLYDESFVDHCSVVVVLLLLVLLVLVLLVLRQPQHWMNRTAAARLVASTQS